MPILKKDLEYFERIQVLHPMGVIVLIKIRKFKFKTKPFNVHLFSTSFGTTMAIETIVFKLFT